MRLTNPTLKTSSLLFGLAVVIATVVPAGVAGAADRIGLGTAGSYGVLAGAGVTNTGPSIINGDLGTCPTPAVTGFPPGVVQGGSIHANDAVACNAQSDLVTGYNDATSRAANTTYAGPTNLGGMTLVSGVYKSPTSFGIVGTLSLDAENDPNAVFVFQAGSTLITATNSNVSLVNGAQACNVFWKVGSSATLGVGSHLNGSVLALSSITANTNASVLGRLLARNGAVTLDSNRVSRPGCVTAPAATTTTTSPTTTSTTTATPTTLIVPTTVVTPTTVIAPTTVVTPTTLIVPTTTGPTTTTTVPTPTLIGPTTTVVNPTTTTSQTTAPAPVAPTPTPVAPAEAPAEAPPARLAAPAGVPAVVAPTPVIAAPTPSTLTPAVPLLATPTLPAASTPAMLRAPAPAASQTANLSSFPRRNEFVPAPATPIATAVDFGGGLPRTGSSLVWQTLVAAVLLAGGFGMVRAARPQLATTRPA